MNHFSHLVVLVVCALISPLAVAQQHPHTTPLTCGAPELTDGQRLLLTREAQAALALKRANRAPTAITYVPIRPHIFRLANGTGGMSVAKMNDIIGTTNRYYLVNGLGIQFYFCGTTPDYVDSDTFYNSFDSANEGAVADSRDVTNAMNMYYVHAFSTSGLGGYAYYPANGLYSTRSFILDESDAVDLGNRLIPHELGHNFNLIHTFEGSTGTNPELVTRGAGANCTTAGDLVCDTPADPYNRVGASTIYVNGCPQYNGTATDPQGSLYTPSITNIMSYYFPCTHDFTDGQYDRVAGGLALRQSHTAYSLDCAPTPVTAPANLSAVLAANGQSVVVTWQDLASNEMGYFVERSTRPNDGFGAVGGVGPNVVTFTDVLVPGQTVYYYRIRPSNSTTGSLSPVVVVNVPICKPTYSASCSVTNGLGSVTVNGTVLSTGSGCAATGYSSLTGVSVTVGAGQSIPLSATLLNNTTSLYTAVWADLNRNGFFETTELLARTPAGSAGAVSLSLTLPLSLTAGLLPIRVLSATTLPTDACGAYAGGEAEDYVLTVANPAGCSTPTSQTATNVTGTSAQLGWAAAAGQFAVQYRLSGTGSWSAIVGISSTTVSVTGLTPGQVYDWQVLTACGLGGSSPLSAISSFTTNCIPPTALNAAPVYGNVAQLNWTGNPGNGYALQWRVQNTSTWTTISGLTSTSYTVTGLVFNTTYEWRVGTLCTTGGTIYANVATFTTNTQVTYCIPSSQYGCSDSDGITGFKIGNFILSSNSGCSPGGYQSFTAVGATLIPGQAYSFTATLISPVFQEGLGMWVDFNNNGSFDSNEKLYTSSTPLATFLAGTITLPANTAPGLLKLRVRVEFNTNTIDPCTAGTFGETEDYVISVPTPCTPASATLAGTQSISIGQTASLTVALTGSSPWSLSVSNGSSFTGLTTSPFTFTVSPTASTTYTLTQVSNGCSTSAGSGTAVVTVTCPLPSADISIANSSTIIAGQSVSLVAALSGTPPWSLTLSDGSSFSGITNWLYTFTVSPLVSTTYTISQVSTICGVGPGNREAVITVLLPCGPPTGLNEVETPLTSVRLNWTAASLASRYVARIRAVGTTAWSSFTSAIGSTTITYPLSNTSAGQPYEWQVQTLCTGGTSTTFSAMRSFTVSCSPPVTNGTSFIPPAETSFSWNPTYPDGSANPATLQWRAVGASTWTTVANLNPYASVSLFNLLSGAYEWQMASQCAVGGLGSYSPVRSFTAECPMTSIYIVEPAATSVALTWVSMGTATYLVNWRITGNPGWPNSLTVNTSNTQLTGLTADAVYEVQVRVLCPNGGLSDFSYVQSFTTLPAADLSLAMAVSKRTPGVNEVVTYSITISNAGPAVANNVKAQSLLPPNMTFVGSSQSAITSGPGSVSVAVGTLPVGISSTFSFSASVSVPGIYRTAAQVTESSLFDPDSFLNSGTADGDDDATTVDLRTRETSNTIYSSPNPIFRILPPVILNQPAPDPAEADVSLGLQTDGRTVATGATLSLSVVVANRGALTASGVVVQLTLPTGWTLAAGSGFTQSGLSVTLPAVMVGLDQFTTTVVPLVAAGSGDKAIRGLITAANQPDLDSPHNNAIGRGEDDEATAGVRVR